jgi:hypothetical protein
MFNLLLCLSMRDVTHCIYIYAEFIKLFSAEVQNLSSYAIDKRSYKRVVMTTAENLAFGSQVCVDKFIINIHIDIIAKKYLLYLLHRHCDSVILTFSAHL